MAYPVNLPKVSIIVPCFNQAAFLSESLDSVVAQTYSNWECIIVNDGSLDDTGEIANRYLEQDKRFKYIRQDNQGVSVARNTGISHSEGVFILPLDGDDIIEPTYLEKAVDWFGNHPETKLVYCKALLFGSINSLWDLDEYEYGRFIWSNCIFCSAVFRRADYDKTGGYNPNMSHGLEDWDFWLSLLKKDDIVHRIDEVLFRYRIKDQSRSTELNLNHLEQTYLQLFKNHREVYEPFCGKLFLYPQVLEEKELLTKELDKVRSSHAYRIGKFLLRPFSFFKKRFL